MYFRSFLVTANRVDKQKPSAAPLPSPSHLAPQGTIGPIGSV